MKYWLLAVLAAVISVHPGYCADSPESDKTKSDQQMGENTGRSGDVNAAPVNADPKPAPPADPTTPPPSKKPDAYKPPPPPANGGDNPDPADHWGKMGWLFGSAVGGPAGALVAIGMIVAGTTLVTSVFGALYGIAIPGFWLAYMGAMIGYTQRKKLKGAMGSVFTYLGDAGADFGRALRKRIKGK